MAMKEGLIYMSIALVGGVIFSLIGKAIGNTSMVQVVQLVAGVMFLAGFMKFIGFWK